MSTIDPTALFDTCQSCGGPFTMGPSTYPLCATCDEREWWAEATTAARGHLFAKRLPAAALARGRCSLTATEAVQTLGHNIRELRADRMPWREIANILGVPIPIAALWAAESLVRP